MTLQIPVPSIYTIKCTYGDSLKTLTSYIKSPKVQFIKNELQNQGLSKLCVSVSSILVDTFMCFEFVAFILFLDFSLLEITLWFNNCCIFDTMSVRIE